MLVAVPVRRRVSPVVALPSGRFLLGALTPDQATEQVFPQAQVRSSAGHNQAVRNVILSSAQAAQITQAGGVPAYVPGTSSCAGAGPSQNLALAKASGQAAITGLNAAAMAGAAVGTILGPATLGISTIVGLFTLFANHHAQAVAKEQSILCTIVPAANNYLQVIDQAVTSGQFSPQQGIAALASLLSDFSSMAASIRKGTDPTSSECNAACVMASALHAVVLEKTSQYQDMIAPPQMPGAGPSISAAAAAPGAILTPGAPAAAIPSTGLPSFLPWAAAILLGWLVLQEV